MAELLNIDPDAVLGKLIRVWAWADSNIKPRFLRNDCVTKNNYVRNCNVTGTSFEICNDCNFDAIINRITCIKNFADAMKKCGWLIQKDDCYELPNFDRHNGKSTKTRLLNAERAQNYRDKNSGKIASRSRNDSVTKNNYETVTIEEKRREDIINPIVPFAHKAKPTSTQDDMFERFWNGVPNKIAKGKAREAWNKAVKVASAETILSGLPTFCEYERRRKYEQDYRPLHPATWLNQERWGDELPPVRGDSRKEAVAVKQAVKLCSRCNAIIQAGTLCEQCRSEVEQSNGAEALKNIRHEINKNLTP